MGVDNSIIKAMAQEVQDQSYKDNIGQLIKKKSNKPFKSKIRIARIKDVILHPQKKTVAYLLQDESYIECAVCELVPPIIDCSGSVK